jgi:hypothetical protein
MVDHGPGRVDPDHHARRPDRARQQAREVAGAAAHVQHALARLHARGGDEAPERRPSPTQEQELRDEIIPTRPRKRVVAVRVTGAAGRTVRVRAAGSVTRMRPH